ncbi:MFS transporter [Streptomyces sp. NBC_01267]|uniref:MFS transporter n=1 Tax=unclassified Streptomyces TaxID=2593676 RepID=UPI002253E848|nr:MULTISPECIES: MFS transporter [unclassified Streptomyces]MCX4548923.1 MFS transporter [Streptomyces sp. NBC_01500]WSC20502.1 MFS transporter [Streptomyces sp. NBC_01766]WSV54535.1 MFS transporter [Streptomyces sp. NBC_01014]
MKTHIPALLRERQFRRYWTGHTVSLLGDEISLIAIPLAAVLVLHADASGLGWLKAAGLVPALLALPAGAWADRWRHRRRVMIACDLGRALLIAVLPVAYALDALSLPLLYAVAFGVGMLSVLFDLCDATLFVALLPTRAYIEGNSLVNGSRALSQMAGPSAGGLLVQVLTAPFALAADALSYLASALCLARVSPAEPPPAAPEKQQLMTGLRWIRDNPVIRASLGAAGTVQFFSFMGSTLLVLYATVELGLGAGLLGLVLGAGAVGALAGSVLAGRVVRRIGVGPAVIAGFLGFTVPMPLVPLAGGPKEVVLLMLFLAEFVGGVGVMIVDIALGSVQAAVVPHALRSRVMGAYRTLNHGFRPLGALTGGALGGALGLRPTLWIAAVGAMLAVLWLLPAPMRQLRELPEPEPGQPAEPVPAPAAEPGQEQRV